MIRIDRSRAPEELLPRINRLFELSAQKIRSIEDSWRPEQGAPVFTVNGRYTARGWTEWTEGLSVRLVAPAVRCHRRSRVPRTRPRAHPDAHGAAPHTRRRPRSRLQQRQHVRRAVANGARRAASRRDDWELRFYALALKVSGAVQARRWTSLPDGGYIYSFNGAHSLFVDTIRSLRALALVAPARSPS